MATLNEWKRKEKFREEEGGDFLLYRGGWDCVGKAGCFLWRGGARTLHSTYVHSDGGTMLKGPSEEPKETLNGY